MGSYDRALLFFLLHEQPEEVRRATLAQTLRVVRPGGRIVIVDYHRPSLVNPLYLPMAGILHTLEPYALGHINVRFFGGMKVQRTWFAADKSGFHILHTLFQTSLRFASIKRYDEFFCADLMVEDGRVARRAFPARWLRGA